MAFLIYIGALWLQYFFAELIRNTKRRWNRNTNLCHSGENIDERIKAVLLVLLGKCNHLKEVKLTMMIVIIVRLIVEGDKE